VGDGTTDRIPRQDDFMRHASGFSITRTHEGGKVFGNLWKGWEMAVAIVPVAAEAPP
jgi:hypothetical protein